MLNEPEMSKISRIKDKLSRIDLPCTQYVNQRGPSPPSVCWPTLWIKFCNPCTKEKQDASSLPLADLLSLAGE